MVNHNSIMKKEVWGNSLEKKPLALMRIAEVTVVIIHVTLFLNLAFCFHIWKL